jgi:hypothetical protein
VLGSLLEGFFVREPIEEELKVRFADANASIWFLLSL